jgi:glyoxylase-like metal-dependent hydrolase (beta-lactamase superfamily II)
MPTFRDLSRRDVVTGLSAAGVAALSAPAFAKAPLLNTQAPGFYRFKIGSIEATVVSDGPLDLGAPQPDIFKGVGKDEFAKLLADNYLPADKVRLEQNTLVLNTGDKLVLIDTGTGAQKLMGPDTGKFLANLKAAGIDPKDIDAVALTHPHPDHCWGLIGEDNAKVFPNAQVYMSEDDFNFWTDVSKAPNDMLKGFIEGTRKQLLPLRERIEFFKDGQEFITGIQAISAPGHTVGHTVFMISSQGKSLCNTGDLAHHHVIPLERPRLEFAFDTDGRQGAATRIKMFGMLAAQRIPILSYHFPWPGVGYLAKQGEGFRYYPSPIQTAL